MDELGIPEESAQHPAVIGVGAAVIVTILVVLAARRNVPRGE